LQSVSSKQLKKQKHVYPRTNQTSVRCKTEADFAIYIKELMQLGIKGYDSLIIDGRVAITVVLP
jgi:hypothetical protein